MIFDDLRNILHDYLYIYDFSQNEDLQKQKILEIAQWVEINKTQCLSELRNKTNTDGKDYLVFKVFAEFSPTTGISVLTLDNRNALYFFDLYLDGIYTALPKIN
jgi:hypothetical protein